MRRSGFTLLELLVVMVIFGIAAALVAVRLLPDDLQLARREADATALLLERAADEAEGTGRLLAWLPEARGARFQQSDGQGGWTDVKGDAEFGARALPGDLRWSGLSFPLTGAGAAAVGGPGASGNAAALDQRPRVVFMPGQAGTDFEIALQTAQGAVVLHGDALGRVRVGTRP